MTTRHTVSHADESYLGNAFHDGYSPDGRRGVRLSHLYFVDFGAVDVLDVNGVAEAQAVASAGNLTLNGALVTNGVAVFDVARGVEIDSSSTDTTQTATITGTDEYGVVMTEDIAFNGTTAVLGQKAFKTVTQVAIDIALAGNATCGTTDILGLPFVVADRSDIITNQADGVLDAITLVAADATDPATATTNDVRGTVDFTDAPDGSVIFTILMLVPDRSTKAAVFGVDQA